ncbi:hypothetical protein NPIL_851 [Nephila pilipes]|uniref:Uncharacterized protein n=1 Tax=Nephila pilipes TaxID=299642 RepID=A0A8X6M7Y8_NEPPI|nr:hypothetical protein NPIL_851 [Nephila pilipes]
MEAKAICSDRTDMGMDDTTSPTFISTDSQPGAALQLASVSPSRKIFDDQFFMDNFFLTKKAIQGRNAFAVWACKFATTKRDNPEVERAHEEI